MGKVGRRRVTPCYRSTFPSAPFRTGRAAFTASGSPVSSEVGSVYRYCRGCQSVLGSTKGAGYPSLYARMTALSASPARPVPMPPASAIGQAT